MSVVVVEAPDPLVSLALAKVHLRVDGDADDLLIAAYIDAVSQHLDGPEGWLGRVIGLQTLETSLTGFPARGALILPFEPVRSIESVTYLDDLGAEITWASGGYQLSGNSLMPIYGGSWPTGRIYADAVRIRWTAGYEAVPAAIVAAVLMMIGDLYKNRETTAAGAAEIPMAANAKALLAPFRNVRV